MALSQQGLNGNGQTTNFEVWYEDSLVSKTNVVDNANALLGVVENEFSITTGWFQTPSGKFGTSHRQKVNLDLNATATSFPGANNSGYVSDINVDAQNATNDHTVAAGRVEHVFMAEWSEILMSLSGGKWNAGDSSGEALSQFCSILRFQTGHYNYYGSAVAAWLDGDTTVFNGNAVTVNSGRSDWVTKTFTGSGSTHGDGDAISFGCALAFLFYLYTQLKFSETEIIGAGSSTLSGAYAKLTGDQGNPFPAFLDLMASVYPSGTPANIPGPVIDNPFPLAISGFWANKDTFGKDEVQEIVNKKGGVWSEAFWVVVDGFSESSFNQLGVTVGPFSGSFANLKGVEIIPNLSIDYENAASPRAPQRIRIPFDIKFSSASLADFPATGSVQYDLATYLTAGGNKISGSDCSTKFELVAGADPYFSNIDTTPGDPNRNNVFYLSQDLRVFATTPGQNNTPVAGGPTFGADSPDGAYTYIQQLLTYLNGNYNDPNGADPLNAVLPSQAAALQGDSSVTPFTIDFSDPFNIHVYNNYNFAIARVRLYGTSGTAGEAKAVRVFFRLWTSQTADTDYQSSTTYLSTPDSAGHPGFPQPGAGHTTIPFFASGNNGANGDYGAGGWNIRDIVIPSGRDSIWVYYGCFLNMYDPANVVDGQQLLSFFTGTHHCLVAEIADDDAPVVSGASPASSDKLAQRNLQVTVSDNPGPADTHRIPQTFDVRPSDPAPDQGPDELMIDWGNVPAGSIASIYWPQVQAADVIALADSAYATHMLTAADTNTISIKIHGGVSYVPIPKGAGDNFAGLLTIDLPQTVITGQEFDVLVRRISTRVVQNIIIRTEAAPSDVEATKAARRPARGRARKPVEKPEPESLGTDITVWRYVVGNFAVSIPVATAQTMLLPEENTLAILKWRLLQMSPANRWYKVLDRYISLIAARVDGLGGNSNSIQPSPTGVPVKGYRPGEKFREYEGKVLEVVYGCFGEFVGFVLDDCKALRAFRTRARGIEEVVLRACRDDLTLVVFVDEDREERIMRLVLRC
jgi:hypothetical protein